MHEKSKNDKRGLIVAASILGILLAVVLVVLGLKALPQDTPMPRSIALIIAGLVQLSCCVTALRGSRVGWSFAIALDSVAALILLIGTPQVRAAWDTSFVLAVLPAAAFALVAILYGSASGSFRGDYGEL